ncbi:MAG: long-chain-fatty-acid--CoA ligase [Dehalococcoidia bacterium]|nr:MAG: long-chain-fatty-acid--CoA ligase [Dehalococcoidia bacterium]
MNTLDFLSIANAICPDRDCVVFEGKRCTFGQVNERSNRLANSLAKLGIKKGDMVAILQVNCTQFLETYYAVAKLGAILVPLNFRAKEDELTYMLNNSGAVAIFVGDRYVNMVNAMRPNLASVQHYISIDGKQENMHYYEDLISSGSPDEVMPDVDDEDTTLLMYTAGTTGRPKGVPMTHNSYGIYVLDNVDPPSPDIEEKNLLTVPLYHVAGFQALLAAVYGGRTLLMMRQFEVNEWMDAVQREKANRAMLVPTMLKRVIDNPDFDKYDLSSLRVITYGAAPMPFEVIKKAIEVMPNVRFINAFGQTETSSTITTLGPEDHVISGTPEEKAKKLKRLETSIGRPMSDVEMKVVDADGNDLPPGEMGEFVARGPRIMKGYFKDEEKTAQAFTKDGWLRTSDTGYMDEDGYFYLAGRGDDMIIRAGENISPEEVETVLYSHPKIEEAAVIGIPDPEWGQEPRAVVVLKEGKSASPEEIIEYCRQKLSSFKRPRSVIFVDELPRNPMGKVLKRVLREQYGQP